MEEKEKRLQDHTVLDPDHPILKRFQAALKEHYLYQINKIKEEIFEYETETKSKNDEKNQLGIQVYEEQQMVCRQQKILEEIIKDLQNITGARQEVENKYNEAKVKLKEARENQMASEKTNLELQNELNGVNLLINQISQWETKIETNIVVNQRIAEKTRKDNLKLSEEKRKQDAQIYKVMRAIWSRETELETMNMQMKLKESEREELEQAAALGNTNLDALQAEYRCLMHSWNSVVVAIGNRDRIVECLKSEKQKVNEKIKSTTSEIGQVKKLTKKQMHDNERLSMNKARVELDITNSKQQIDELAAKYNEYVRTNTEFQKIVEQTDKDIEARNDEIHWKEMALKQIIKDYDKISQRKFLLERQLLKDIENQAANDTVAENLYRNLNIVKEKKKDLEIFMNEAENKQSRIVTEIETQKFANEENTRLMSDIEKERNDLESEADAIQTENNKYQMLFRKKERHVTVLNNKLEKINEKMSISIVISPQDLRILTLEKQIEETQEKIQHLQIFWLREQKNLLNISKERQEQIHKLNLLKKQNLILRQKNLKVSNDVENYKKQEAQIMQNINSLQNKASVLCDNLNKKKDKKSTLDKSNYYLQSQYDGKLKDAELECLQMQAEISDIEEEKANLSKELVELNREALEWEKKVKLARETKRQLRGEMGSSGELDEMRQEIQRMNVIYSQLKKAQEKLVKDLEHCVARRDAIFTVAEARQKRSKQAEEKTRINYTRKMDDIRNKIKQQEAELKSVKVKIEELLNEKRQLEYEIHACKNKIEFFDGYVTSLKHETEKRMTNRQLKFEILLMMQKKVNVYSDLVAHRQPYLYTKKDKQQSEYHYQKDLNNKLCRVVENLKSDFPNYRHQFSRLYNTLKLSVYTAYQSHLDVRNDEL